MARKITEVDFEVTGSMSFPVDMLRYDCCYPANSESASAILSTMEPYSSKGGPYRVRLTYRPRGEGGKAWLPTEDRWRSFCWSVDLSSIVRR